MGDSIWQQFTIDSDDDELPDEDNIDDDAEEMGGLDEWDEQPVRRGVEKEDDEEDSEDEEDSGDEDNLKTMPHAEERAHRAGEKVQRQIAQEEEEAAEAEAKYFDEVMDFDEPKEAVFAQLNLSRPLLRAVEAAGYTSPTPVQIAVIPLALEGRDVCASAATGSGKTGAFVLPFLERLLYRPKDVAAIRVLVVTPTRELATQVFTVLQKMSMFTDITSALICGGKKDLKSQEALLRSRPDVVVATPGRLLDHLRNSQSVSVDELDVLVLDEVDRLLELGFQQELEEMLRYCPPGRQTLLFSATMTAGVDDLARLSLRKPVRVKTGGGVNTVAPRLVQEFVKLRPGKEHEREAVMAALVCRNFKSRTIVFCETKTETHRLCTVLRVLGAAVSELHGNLSQEERYESLQLFREGKTDVLVATDVAARGLDIPAVRTVINSEMPRSGSTYIHRVGRTARAGSSGRAVTLVSDGRRGVMKKVLKGEGSILSAEAGQVLSRTVPPAVVTEYSVKIAELEESIKRLVKSERDISTVETALREAERAENLLRFEEEISSRPARTWHQTETQKKELKAASKEKVTALVPQQQQLSVKERGLRMAREDNYGEDDGKEKHSVSRKKKRRLEALAQGEEGESVDTRMRESKKAKVALTRSSEAKREKENSASLTQIKKGQKIIRPKVAIGGLDADLYQSADPFRNRKSRKKVETLKDFKEFDPLKRLRKGGKLGKSSFKSKGKFKRR